MVKHNCLLFNDIAHALFEVLSPDCPPGSLPFLHLLTVHLLVLLLDPVLCVCVCVCGNIWRGCIWRVRVWERVVV